MKNEIVIYNHESSLERIEVRVDEENETFWLTQAQIARLFSRDRTVISKHLKQIFNQKELDENVVCAFFAHTTPHGAISGKSQENRVKYYNLDAILSVGYRVNSKRGTQFRQWATQRLKDYLLKGYAINNRITRLENKLEGLTNKVEEMDLQINTKTLPTQGVFFDGQIFDAYELTSRFIRSAQESIILIDNYLDESTFTLLAKKRKHVMVTILTKTPLNEEHKASKQLALDLKKANEQYGNFTVKSFTKSHDRFLVIDQNEVYHLGASLKDLGKKWFAFTKLNKQSVDEMLRVI
jgi:hypothetical protein